MNKHISLGILYCVIAQFVVWFQTNSQFVWPAAKDHKILLSVVGGTIISYLFIIGVGEIAQGFNGQVWPSRLIPAATGTVVFTIMTWAFLNQGPDLKTGICILLSFVILAIQILWK